jgi:glycosyltransferase involved in cell wall biosynthesis
MIQLPAQEPPFQKMTVPENGSDHGTRPGGARRQTRRPLRILVAYNSTRERTGGMSRIMGLIHDQLVLAGHSVEYFCAEELPWRSSGGWGRFTYPLALLHHAWAAARSGRPYDVINVHEPSGAAISRLKRIAGKPKVVVTSHGLETRGWAERMEDVKLGRDNIPLSSRVLYPATLIWQARVALASSDHVFCLNLEDRDYLDSQYRIPRSRVTRIHPGADSVYASAAAGRDYGNPETILFAGTWLKRKGTPDLVAAFSVLARRHPRLKLLVLNCGAAEAVVRESFPGDVRAQVIHRQTASEEGTARAFAVADIYVLPSLFEGTPLTLIEAMFSGLPVITTAACGMKDVIENGRTGLLVPVRSPDSIVAAVNRLLGDPSLRRSLGQAARADALEMYTWRRVAEPVQEVYERLCA